MLWGPAWIALAGLSIMPAQEPAPSATELSARAAGAAKRTGGAQDAIRLYHQALDLWLKAGDRLNQARTLLALGRLEAQTGDKPRAKATFSSAADLFHRLQDAAGESDAVYGIARQQFDLLEISAAIANYQKAADLKRQSGDTFGQALTLHNLGAALAETGETGRALECYRQALDLRRKIADRPGIGYSLYGIATIYWARADIEAALDTYRGVLENWRALGDRSGEANTLNSMGLAWQALGDRAAAAGAYRESLRIWRALKNSAGEAYTLNNMALADTAAGRLESALASYQNALILLQGAHDVRGEGYVLHNLADLEVLRGHRALATRLYEEALALKTRAGDRYGEAYTLQKIGEGRQAAGDLPSAMAFYNRALALHRAVGDRAGEAAALAALARADEAGSRREEARQRMLEAIALVERLRVEVTADELRASYFATQQDYYEYLIGLLMRMHRDSEALEISERTRGRVLLELLTAGHQDRRELDGRVREETARLRRGAPRVPSRLDSLLAEYDAMEAADSPRARTFGSFRPFTAAAIQRDVLEPDALLLEYSLGRQASYAWLVGRDLLLSAELPPRRTIERVARRYRDALEARSATADATATARAGRLRRADAELSSAAAALRNMLLGPFASRLGRARLLLAADGVLHGLPIEALPGVNGRPLIADHEVVLLPAASLVPALRLVRSRQTGSVPPVAVLADPVFTPSAGFPPLRFSRVEAKSIADVAPGAVIALGPDARRSALRLPEFRHAGILHFATHLSVDDEHAARSGVVLSDGVLRLPEIAALDFEARTVVLSACRTALGTPLRGEGPIGLTRGFLLAGASRVVASLWDVQDQATALLMREFYRGMLQRGQAPAAALRSAQLSLRADPRFSHPYYWAGFVLTGDWKP
jgi:CHAT domain-containing protein/tetratricopeptide (TPR) repeat protein